MQSRIHAKSADVVSQVHLQETGINIISIAQVNQLEVCGKIPSQKALLRLISTTMKSRTKFLPSKDFAQTRGALLNCIQKCKYKDISSNSFVELSLELVF